MHKLGVIQIIDSLHTGGAEVLAVNIANSLSENGLNSHICATREEGKLLKNIHKNVGYLFLNRKKTIDFKSYFLFKKYLKKNNITILHAHATSFFFAFCIKLIYPKIKVVYHIHHGKIIDSEKTKLILLKTVSLFFKSIITVNKDIKHWAKAMLYCKNVYFLNNFPVFNNYEKITSLKGNQDKRIVHLAGFREAKDHENLIHAFELFIKKNKDWSLHLVGPLNDDLYTKKILQLINDKKMQNVVFTYGSCLDIFNILNQATIGVLSSKTEGLPVSLLEYGLAGLPVVVTDVGEMNKVVIHKESGYVVDSKNYKELYKRLHQLANSEEKRSFFAKKHHQHIIQNYSKESFTEKILNTYKN